MSSVRMRIRLMALLMVVVFYLVGARLNSLAGVVGMAVVVAMVCSADMYEEVRHDD